jgi:hypothetical protein
MRVTEFQQWKLFNENTDHIAIKEWYRIVDDKGQHPTYVNRYGLYQWEGNVNPKGRKRMTPDAIAAMEAAAIETAKQFSALSESEKIEALRKEGSK